MEYIAKFTCEADGVEGRVFYRGDGRIGTALVDLDVETDWISDGRPEAGESGIMCSNIYAADRLGDATAHAESMI